MGFKFVGGWRVNEGGDGTYTPPSGPVAPEGYEFVYVYNPATDAAEMVYAKNDAGTYEPVVARSTQ